MTGLDVARLREVAEAAAAEDWMPGWWRNDAPGWVEKTVGVAEIGDHMTTFDPPTVLALLARLEAAEAAVSRVRALRLIEELEEVRSFVMVETRHVPTARHLSRLRRDLRAALDGEADQ